MSYDDNLLRDIERLERSRLYNRNRDKTMGEKLEIDFQEMHNEYFQKPHKEPKSKTPLFKAPARLDKKEGTDFVFPGLTNFRPDTLRMDVTTAFDKKDHMPFVYTTDIPAYKNKKFSIGIRFGNDYYDKKSNKNYVEFSKPVIVVGINCDDGGQYNYYRPEIRENIRQHFDTIFEIAQLCYDQYVLYDDKDLTEEDIQAEILEISKNDVRLEKNPRYIPEKHASSHVQETYRFVENMIENYGEKQNEEQQYGQ